MADERDDIRARIDIVDLVSQRVALKRSGKHFTGLCPFHEDKRPSFTVDSQTGRYKCWSCGEAGDIFTWVMKTENVEFAEALRTLAQRAGVQLQTRGRAVPASEREAQRAAMAEALSFFKEQLQGSPAARQYCLKRGLDADILSTWEIGYAPDIGEALAVTLQKKGFSLAECKGLFLVDQDASGGYYDKFRGRLMFPIRDEKGELVAFGGRVLGDGMPKYINSSDTPLYRKGRVLYGMDKARDYLSKSRSAVLVEGYLDVIACHRSGVKGAIASLGTALSQDHAKLLKRWADQVTVLYDSDDAGQKAADRAIEILESEGIRAKVALMPKGEDPDTLFRTAGPEAVAASATGAGTPTAFRLRQLEGRLSPTEEAFWTEAVAILASAKQGMEIERHLTRLAPMYPGLKDVSSAIRRLSQMVDAARRSEGRPKATGARPSVAPEFVPLKEKMLTGEMIIFLALHHPSFQRSAWTVLRIPELFETGAAVSLAKSVIAAFPTEPPTGPASQWLHRIEPEQDRTLLSDMLHDFRSENLTEDRIAQTIDYLRKAAAKRELKRLKQENATPEERQRILVMLRELNPDQRVVPAESGDDPFA